MNDLRASWITYALLSAFFAALTTILAKVGIQGVPSNLATAIRTVVILVIAWGWVFTTGEVNDLPNVSRRALIFLVLSGVATGLSWLFYFKALQNGKASIVAPIDKSSLVMVMILAALFLGEAVSWQAMLGAGLIVGGTLIIIMA
jgi:bacterial/archaeal transporter family protein